MNTVRQFRSSHRSVVLMVLGAVAILTAAGCNATQSFHCDKCCRPESAPVGQIHVSGPLAVARAIPVSEEGVPLSDVVELAIRPGYRGLSELAFAEGVSIDSIAAPVSDSHTSVEAAFRAWAGEPVDVDVDDLQDEFVRRLARNREQSGALAGDLDAIIADLTQRLTLLSARGDRMPPLKDNEIAPSEADILQFRILVAGVLGDWEATTASPAPPATVSKTVSGSRPVSVIVSQRSERRLIIPLRTVTLTPAGDIRVLPGEHVTIAWSEQLPEAATASSTAATGRAAVAVSALSVGPEMLELTRSGSTADMTLAGVFNRIAPEIENSVMVSRIASDGVTELHLLSTPLDTQLSFGGEANAQLRTFELSDQDVVSFGLLELNPLVVQGRTITRLTGELSSEACLQHLEATAGAATGRTFPGLSRWHKRSHAQLHQAGAAVMP